MLAESPLILFVSALLGLICGSFVTALSHRLPRGEDFVSGRSRCPHCKTPLAARDLVPVLSWLMSRGRCRYCQAPVSARYPAIELLSGFLFVLVAVLAEPAAVERIVLLWGLAVVFLALTVIDLEFRRLPNGLILFAFGLTGLLAWRDGREFGAVLLAIGIALSIGVGLRVIGLVIDKKPGLGWGDIKLAMAVSVALPLDALPVFLSVGGVTALLLAAWFGWAQRQMHIPCGPALCAGAFAAFL